MEIPAWARRWAVPVRWGQGTKQGEQAIVLDAEQASIVERLRAGNGHGQVWRAALDEAAPFRRADPEKQPLVSGLYEGDPPASLILVSASRPFFLAALRELRLDSAAAVSGWGSQGPAERRPLRILMR